MVQDPVVGAHACVGVRRAHERRVAFPGVWGIADVQNMYDIVRYRRVSDSIPDTVHRKKTINSIPNAVLYPHQMHYSMPPLLGHGMSLLPHVTAVSADVVEFL